MRGLLGIRRARLFVSQHEPVLGTTLQIYVRAGSPQLAHALEQRLLDEIDHSARVFSVFDPTSELARWRADDSDDAQPGPELLHLLDTALHWQAVGGGAFNPAVGVLTARWKQAEVDDVVPSREELAELARSICSPRYRVDRGVVSKTGDCTQLNFNALAKGMVVDIATARVIETERPESLTVNIGGDLVHSGSGELVVGIEDPLRAYDNGLPLARVAITNAGMATSGSARRGFRIDGTWFSHIIDPTTGWPVDHVASASVIAPGVATADVVATLLSVLEPTAGRALVDSLTVSMAALIGFCIVDPTGVVTTNAVWDAQAR